MSESHVCIYSKQPFNDAEMKSGDHIFLASIGGQKKLPKSYVSHEVNNSFSKLEKYFSRDSLISIIRQFEGPGKRGSLSEKKASKSKVCVMTSQNDTEDDKERYQLGYIQSSKPYILNQFILSLDTDTIATSFNPESIQENESFMEKINSLVDSAKKSSEYVLIIEDGLSENIALFGELDQKWFLSVKHKGLISTAEKLIETILESKSIGITGTKEHSSQVMAHQQYQFDIGETFRIVAKMAFNFLASDQGEEFVLDSKFDPIRDWIYTGEGDNQFVAMISTEDTVITEAIPNIPERAHCILITQDNKRIIATVSFYGESYSFIVVLATLNFGEIHYLYPSGIICDWKGRSEYTLLEHLNKEHLVRR